MNPMGADTELREDGGTPAECMMGSGPVDMRAEDVEGGAALIVTTGAGQVAQLRSHARCMADCLNGEGGGAGQHDCMMGSGGSAGGGMGMGHGGNGGGMGMDHGGNGGGMGMGGHGSGMGMGHGDGGEGGNGHGSGNGMHANCPMGGSGDGGGMEMGMGALVRVTASAEDIEGGARIVLLALDPVDVDELRVQVRNMAAGMPMGGCSFGAPGDTGGGDDHESHHGGN